MLEKINTSKERFIQTQKASFFPGRQKFLQEKIKGVTGSTWDATHLTSFLSKSFYSNKKSQLSANKLQRSSYSIRRRKSGDYFFKNLRYDQNKSHIGYSKVNPLVSNVQISQQRQQALVSFFLSRTNELNQNKKEKSPVLRCQDGAKFNFQGNKVKFRATDPLTSRYELEKPLKEGFRMERMKRQIQSRYPHGITGIDNPQNSSSIIYKHSEEKSSKVRQQPMSHTSFELDREWKSKGRVPPIKEQYRFRQTECMRKFRNENSHGYNIINNTIVNQ